MEPLVLRTPRLVLDLPRGDDAAAVHAAAQDPLLQRFLTLPETFRLSDAQRLVDSAEHDWRRDRAYAFAVRDGGTRDGRQTEDGLSGDVRPEHDQPGHDRHDDNALIGMITLTAHDWSIGYWLAPLGRGRGVAVEALGAVLDWHVEQHPGTPVRWECRVGNDASLAVARASGFRYLGTGPGSVRHRDGTPPESWLAVLDEWPRRSHAGWPI